MTGCDWPTTVEEAADRILAGMTAEDKACVRERAREELSAFHFGWGTGIRNAFGLWRGNRALLESSGTMDPDHCSMVIIERVWEKLNERGDP